LCKTTKLKIDIKTNSYDFYQVTSLIYTKCSLLKVLPYDRSFKEVKQTVLLKQFSVMK